MYPRNVIKVFGIEPSIVTRDNIVGKQVHLISSQHNGARKISLSKAGKVISISEYKPEIYKKIRGDAFQLHLSNGKIVPSNQVLIVETGILEKVKDHLSPVLNYPLPQIAKYPKIKKTECRKYLNSSFTCEFLFAFFKLFARDIANGWENLDPRDELYKQIPELTGEEWTPKNEKIFDHLYNFTEKVFKSC